MPANPSRSLLGLPTVPSSSYRARLQCPPSLKTGTSTNWWKGEARWPNRGSQPASVSAVTTILAPLYRSSTTRWSTGVL